MKRLKLTGGARIGQMNATWPFASLTIDEGVLSINISILGSCYFSPGNIVSIDVHRGLMSNGIRISHNVESYKGEVIFWTKENAEQVLEMINETGFFENKNNVESIELLEKQRQGTFLLKFSPSLLVLLTIFSLFAMNIYRLVHSLILNNNIPISPFGITIQIAFIIILSLSTALCFSVSFRKIFVKKGRETDLEKAF